LNKYFLSQWACRLCVLLLGAAITGGVAAQAFPSKPIRLVVPFAPGGVVDVTARQLGPKLSEALGQPVLIENKSGAGGTLAADYVAKSAPDGHTLLVAFDSHAVNPHIYKSDLRYDTFKDLAPISFIGSIPLLLATSTAFPANDIPAFIQVAKSKPGTISYASVGAGSSGHLAAEQLKLLANVDMLHIPFKGGARTVGLDGRASPVDCVCCGSRRAFGAGWKNQTAGGQRQASLIGFTWRADHG
jgi:tripartite-type tricarboxylate transporter receptor subunit TctC